MEIPIYSKNDLASANAQGEHGLIEFDQYIQELRSSGLLTHHTAFGIVNLVAQNGTVNLSDSQKNALRITTEQFPMEQCIRCGSIIVVKAGEEPDYCDSCQEFIQNQ